VVGNIGMILCMNDETSEQQKEKCDELLHD